MKYNIKNILIFVAGLATGAFASFVISKEKMNEQVDREVERLQEELNTRILEAEEHYKNELKIAVGSLYSEDPDIKEEAPTTEKEKKTEKKNIDYAGISKKTGFASQEKKPIEEVMRELHVVPASEKAHPEDDEPEDDENEPTEDEDFSDGPYTLTQDEFFQTNDGFEKISLNYYAGDNVLTDMSDQPIPDIEPLVGNHNLTKFGEKSGDKNILYVRNEKSKCDLEICLNESTYTEVVLGIPLEPKAKQEKPKPKRIKKSSIDGKD